MDVKVEEIIELLSLKPHPEGGYFRESYRTPGRIAADALPEEYGSERSYCTAIYYLLEGKAYSRLHRIASDEIWHFYLGDPLVVAEIDHEGQIRETTLGPDLKDGQRLQHVVTAKCWFGAYLPHGSNFALTGCTVAPGFDFADFEMGDKEELLKRYPKAKAIIERLT